MSIPLVQEATKDAINTSIIAIKHNIERINMLLGLMDSGSSDLSGLATKQELQDAVNSLQPVDEVTLNNMQSVTSNAVAEKLDWKKAGIFTTNQTVTIPSTAEEVSIALFRNSDSVIFNGNQTPLKYIADGTVSMIIAWIGGDSYMALQYTGRDSQNNYTFTALWGGGDWSVIVFYR